MQCNILILPNISSSVKSKITPSVGRELLNAKNNSMFKGILITELAHYFSPSLLTFYFILLAPFIFRHSQFDINATY